MLRSSNERKKKKQARYRFEVVDPKVPLARAKVLKNNRRRGEGNGRRSERKAGDEESSR